MPIAYLLVAMWSAFVFGMGAENLTTQAPDTIKNYRIEIKQNGEPLAVCEEAHFDEIR